MSKKYFIIIGSYGAGKTELSLNLAIQEARKSKSVALVDLDIVNPYFRSGFHKELLDTEEVDLIASQYRLDFVDTPAVTPKVLSAFDSNYDSVFIDVGGDPVGATALGQYYHKFITIPKEDLNVLFVLNAKRPLTSNINDIIEMMDKIQAVSRLKINGLINNTNLADETEIKHIIEGDEILEEVSIISGIPIVYFGIKQELINEYNLKYSNSCSGKPIVINSYTKFDGSWNVSFR